MTGLSKKLHAKDAAKKQQSITLVNQSFDERKIVVLRSDASDKTAKQNESDDHFRLADDSLGMCRAQTGNLWMGHYFLDVFANLVFKSRYLRPSACQH